MSDPNNWREVIEPIVSKCRAVKDKPDQVFVLDNIGAAGLQELLETMADALDAAGIGGHD